MGVYESSRWGSSSSSSGLSVAPLFLGYFLEDFFEDDESPFCGATETSILERLDGMIGCELFETDAADLFVALLGESGGLDGMTIAVGRPKLLDAIGFSDPAFSVS